jgi:LmbE family N-acetylglucosaminyl deacetylase
MRSLQLAPPGTRLSVLLLGAHSDDIEIGAGATVLNLIAGGADHQIRWCVLSGGAERQNEARASATEFLDGCDRAEVEVLGFRDSFFPQQAEQIKTWFETLKMRMNPDVIFTHYRDDAHQDHREVCRLTWNTFRDNLILEYEIPKWDGDLGQPNLFMPITANTMERKIELLERHFKSQRSKHWFDIETFRGLARLRGNECRAPERYAEAFFSRKFSMCVSGGWARGKGEGGA